VSGIATATYTVIMPTLALGSNGAPPRWQYQSRSLTTLRSKKQGHRCPRLEGTIHDAASAFSDYSDNSTGVRVRFFASYTLTWICGYFSLSSKPAFNASAEITYSVLNLPSISRTYPSDGRTLADGFFGLVAGASADGFFGFVAKILADGSFGLFVSLLTGCSGFASFTPSDDFFSFMQILLRLSFFSKTKVVV
jgi:hypothetical protein